ncbi:PIR protein CIR protein [Plasmodium vinckei vinckei]|uniref:PIR protein CIR protein n=1 Tax=Plasmodium vinckei vinckei TaxID=54757 RepID=A0A449BMT9_PLAVN|nr:PIR protein CIR protein [Plasmodium vinckei vinckei]VEV54732.1 PIR protein CIR protein [Plasmodium vinckei vinckei]
MTKTNYSIKDLYYDIYTINDYFWEDKGQLKVNPKYKSIHNYCHYENNSRDNNCHDYFQLASCGVIYLLKNLKKYGLEYDKFAEYVILWLNYNLNIKTNNEFTNLNEFYTKYIENNNCYNDKIKGDDDLSYKDIININKDLMGMDIKEISKFNYPFNILFYLYYEYHHEYWNCEKNVGYAKNFVQNFEELNEDSKNIEGSLYTQILSTLSNDYINLKNIYYEKNYCNFPSIPDLTPKKISAQNPVGNSVENSGKGDEQILGQPSYSIEDVYKEINTIDGNFGVNVENGKPVEHAKGPITKYCPYITATKSNICTNYIEMANSGVINLLDNLKDKFDSKYDKLAEYAILLLSYKLNQHSQYSSTNLNDFYTKYIENNEYYKKKINGDNGLTYKEIIDEKKDLMNAKEISKFNYPFSILCILYNGIKTNNRYCINYSNYPKTLANEFEKLNNDSNINGNASYRILLSTLSDDYNNLINNYDYIKSCNFPTLSPVKTSSSSSIASKLIPGLSISSVISAFLGIAYKYSLFGIDKLFQRQYIRKKLKQVKKKMKLNI